MSFLVKHFLLSLFYEDVSILQPHVSSFRLKHCVLSIYLCDVCTTIMDVTVNSITIYVYVSSLTCPVPSQSVSSHNSMMLSGVKGKTGRRLSETRSIPENVEFHRDDALVVEADKPAHP